MPYLGAARAAEILGRATELVFRDALP